jgi:hypothetical protein
VEIGIHHNMGINKAILAIKDKGKDLDIKDKDLIKAMAIKGLTKAITKDSIKVIIKDLIKTQCPTQTKDLIHSLPIMLPNFITLIISIFP